MGANCSTTCFPLVGPVIIAGAPDVYNKCDPPLSTPYPLNIVITPLGDGNYNFAVALDENNPFKTISLGNIDYNNAKGTTGVAGVSFPQVKIEIYTYVAVQLDQNIEGIDNNLYKSGDQYILVHNGCVLSNHYYLVFIRNPNVRVIVSGTDTFSESDTSILPDISETNNPADVSQSLNSIFRVKGNPSNICQQNKISQVTNGVIVPRDPKGSPGLFTEQSSVNVPRIRITGQTNVDGTDLGDAIFEIYDEYEYYNTCKIPDNHCIIDRTISPDRLKTTKLRQCCLYMISVLRGEGKTAYEKVWNLYTIYHWDIGLTFLDFAENLIVYALAKYVLSYILYGNFNVNYLLRRYDEKFLHDLGKSRFCSFIEYFESPTSPGYGYAKYFKYK